MRYCAKKPYALLRKEDEALEDGEKIISIEWTWIVGMKKLVLIRRICMSLCPIPAQLTVPATNLAAGGGGGQAPSAAQTTTNK